HKGTASAESAWRKIRETLAEDGMLIEYSATFAQVLNREKQRQEYGKRILADYQYRYFYHDGYGKDFKALNVDPGAEEEVYEDRALAGGLLLFYRQMRLFRQHKERLRPFNLRKPLWVFVGQTVTKEARKKLGVVEEDTHMLTDVGRVVRFLKRFLEDGAWGREAIYGAIHDSDFLGQGNNPFAPYLEDFQGMEDDALYDDICETVFGGQGALDLRQLPTPGEIGLRLSASREGAYFGLVNIGDTAGFRKLMEKEGIPIAEDPLLAKQAAGGGVEAKSLFSDIDEPMSPVNLLIGARKFAEGWSSWRVSTMALLYIGKNQGPLIIQLFGRGVRLLGRDHSLKRSGEVWLEPLETLYIVGLKADYVANFAAETHVDRAIEDPTI
ncbi:MAG: restriction endonuclease subunit R, partial [Gammaproteobacteria bacterium]